MIAILITLFSGVTPASADYVFVNGKKALSLIEALNTLKILERSKTDEKIRYFEYFLACLDIRDASPGHPSFMMSLPESFCETEAGLTEGSSKLALELFKNAGIPSKTHTESQDQYQLRNLDCEIRFMEVDVEKRFSCGFYLD